MNILPFGNLKAMLGNSAKGLTMRLGIALAISLFCVAALMPAPAGAAASWPARAVAAPDPDITRIQGSAKIRKECEVKADKQKLRGLSREAYVERCMEALSFNTIYGTNNGTR